MTLKSKPPRKPQQIPPPGPLATLKFRSIRETVKVANGYHKLISAQLFGRAMDEYWDEKIVMRWTDGRVYRGLGTCSALLADLVHKVELVENTYSQPSVGAGSFNMQVVTRQRLLQTGELIEITRDWSQRVRGGKIVEISEHFLSLLLLHEAEPGDGATAKHTPAAGAPPMIVPAARNTLNNGHAVKRPPAKPVRPTIVGRTLIPFENAVAWLSERGV